MDLTRRPESNGAGDDEAPIRFKPLTKGLGFHPFSDGLPYAPMNPKPERPGGGTGMGSGAVAAGPARIAAPVKPRPVQPRPVQPKAGPTGATSAGPARPVEAVMPAPAAFIVERHGYGYLFKRVIAYLMDSGLNIGLCVAAFGFALKQIGIPYALLRDPEILFLSAVFLAVFNWALITAQEVAFRTSIGKHLFGLSLPGNGPTIFLRAFYFPVSLVFLGLGIFWGLFNRRKRCWHDALADLQPFERAQL